MEILILFGLILMNGVFAMSEMAVVSARKARLQHLADEGKRGARVALRLAQRTFTPSHFARTPRGDALVNVVVDERGVPALIRKRSGERRELKASIPLPICGAQHGDRFPRCRQLAFHQGDIPGKEGWLQHVPHQGRGKDQAQCVRR